MDKKEILEVLQQVYDPDYVDHSIVDMGLVTEDDIIAKDNSIEVAYSLTAAMCPFSAAIGLMIKYALEKKLKVPVSVRLREGHRQEEAVAELLLDSEQSAELMRKLEEFGILERCVRLGRGRLMSWFRLKTAKVHKNPTPSSYLLHTFFTFSWYPEDRERKSSPSKLRMEESYG